MHSSEGRAIPLRAQSAQVLAVLAAHPNQTVTKETLFESVWPDVSVTDDSLTQCIADIRKAIGDKKRTILRTVPKKGYQLVVADAPAHVTAPTPRRRPPLGMIGLLVIAIAVPLLLVGYIALSRALQSAPAAQADLVRPSIIVLPFKDLSPNGDLAHFADGMTEDLITGLSRWQEIQVVDRGTAMSFKSGGLDTREITERTHTQYALEGSIRQIGDTMRATAQLVDGATGRNLWADQYDETGSDILAIHDGIIRRIEQSLAGNTGQIRADEQRKSWSRPSASLDEYGYYLRGHSVFYEFTADAMVRAISIWREGRALYPESGHLKVKEAWGRELCNDFHCALGPFDFDETRQLLEEGLADPALPPIGYRHGLWLRASLASKIGDRDTVIATSRELAESFPSDVEGLMRSLSYLTRVGALEEGKAILEQAGPLNLRPMPYFYSEAAYFHYVQGDCTAAKPYLHLGNFPADGLMNAGCFVEFGQLDRARAEMQRLEQAYGFRTSNDFPTDITNLPKVRARLEAQLAKIGWPE